MSTLLDRVLSIFDAPRFCPDCGEPIKVKHIGGFDPKTGEARPAYVWHCPDVHISATGQSLHAEQRGNVVHPYGRGKPRWYVA